MAVLDAIEETTRAAGYSVARSPSDDLIVSVEADEDVRRLGELGFRCVDTPEIAGRREPGRLWECIYTPQLAELADEGAG